MRNTETLVLSPPYYPKANGQVTMSTKIQKETIRNPIKSRAPVVDRKYLSGQPKCIWTPMQSKIAKNEMCRRHGNSNSNQYLFLYINYLRNMRHKANKYGKVMLIHLGSRFYRSYQFPLFLSPKCCIYLESFIQQSAKSCILSENSNETNIYNFMWGRGIYKFKKYRAVIWTIWMIFTAKCINIWPSPPTSV